MDKQPVRWAELKAECGSYRDGFVAVFRKYEGQPTDEKDKQGRTVKVTMRSFALHMKIPESTFKSWVRTAAAADLPQDQRERGDREERGARSILRDAPMEQVERIISELPRERQQAIGAAAKESYLTARQEMDERERRMTPAEHKDREEGRRVVRDMTDGIINTFSPITIVNHLEAAGEELSAATERGGLTYEQMHQIDEADARWRSVLAFAKEMANE